jgi:hypothetical protein
VSKFDFLDYVECRVVSVIHAHIFDCKNSHNTSIYDLREYGKKNTIQSL